jgi:hypothetical protein
MGNAARPDVRDRCGAADRNEEGRADGRCHEQPAEDAAHPMECGVHVAVLQRAWRGDGGRLPGLSGPIAADAVP